MGFNEKLHAYIAARFYVRLTHSYGEKGKAAFIHATQFYAGQRGRRMAKRAIADSQPLTYETYRAYSEWESTEEMKAAGCANRSEVLSTGPVWEFHVTVCPWHEQFAAMGLQEAGLVYCAYLDSAICRGFNPYLTYEVPQTLHSAPYCVQRAGNLQGLAPGQSGQETTFDPAKARPREERLRSFAYHCAHSYWAYARVSAAVFGAEGKTLAEAVLADIAEDWGDDYNKGIRRYQNVDFEEI